MNARSPMQSYWSNSLAIRQEIQRFESVHPSIYAIYDLIEAIPDPLIQQQIREHVVCIEDSFVNSQEWTLSRSVPDLKLGILGSVQSGKSALVHRYLTGSYMQEESPEGGRFKKEVILDGQSYLLLIRDEGGAPEMQFTHWVDAIIFVFSLENELSFQAVYSYYAKMAHYRNAAEIPLILVGTQDAISESNPRLIDDMRARKLASDLKRCSYYETCATYGLNVERVFQDACQRIVQTRYPSLPSTVTPVPSTPNHSQRSYYGTQSSKPYDSHSTSSQSTSSSGTLVTGTSIQNNTSQGVNQGQQSGSSTKEKEMRESTKEKSDRKKKEHQHLPPPQQLPPPLPEPDSQEDRVDFREVTASTPLAVRKNKKPTASVQKSNSFSGATDLRQHVHHSTANFLARKNKQSLKPTFMSEKMDSYMMELQIHDNSPFTPLLTRMTRVRSSLILAKKEDEKKCEGEKLGSGRAIPLKQGYLYKKSHGLNKEWKKKYVCLQDQGKLTYHPSLHDYMDDVHGKEIPLVHTTVKIPGLRPRGSRTTTTTTTAHHPPPPPVNGDISSLSVSEATQDGGVPTIDNSLVIPNSSITPPGFDGSDSPRPSPRPPPRPKTSGVPRLGINNSALSSKAETPNVKKRHRRAKSGGIKNIDPSQGDDSDGYEFVIVSLENKQWHFEAGNGEERDEWVCAIEQQILTSLQGNDSSKSKALTDVAGMQAIRNVRGNNACADCGSPNPDWASINMGALICIECSGIHRNLGTHISKVRSLDLDEWPPEVTKVMTAIGNSTVNSVWEASAGAKERTKPTQSSPRDEKERWVKSKYELKELLPPLPYVDIPVNQQLIDALVREDIRNIVIILGHGQPDDINAPYSKDDGRTALHIAAALGNVVFVQLLLWNNASVKVVDHEGRNALWYAKSSGSTECVELLINNGCPEHPTLPRRRGSAQPSGKNDVFDKLPASVI
ncbi:arf-GAP with GTPase, ANK repeat and PH domain-containing protein 1-like isoform X3 [Haliotis rubra]|uniref:arf-GAP with GTPase, ANK repeat and PH domain-containing protein 1-like isoform X3 n=1 Tax=Haliotis rubra TaxID=36100 RepID=UPI001EE51E4A|nr:arf-GAP with GTPase, ANK repeat and PH domain-containing protein 1-like isoform X3 [Haliotis rubra]